MQNTKLTELQAASEKITSLAHVNSEMVQSQSIRFEDCARDLHFRQAEGRRGNPIRGIRDNVHHGTCYGLWFGRLFGRGIRDHLRHGTCNGL